MVDINCRKDWETLIYRLLWAWFNLASKKVHWKNTLRRKLRDFTECFVNLCAVNFDHSREDCFSLVERIMYCFIVGFHWCAIESAPMPPWASLGPVDLTNRVACCLFSSRAKNFDFLQFNINRLIYLLKGLIYQTSTVIVISIIGYHNCKVCFPREKSDAIIYVGCNSLVAKGDCWWFVEISFSMYMPNEGFNTMEDFAYQLGLFCFFQELFVRPYRHVNTLPSHTPLPSLPTTLSLLHTRPCNSFNGLWSCTKTRHNRPPSLQSKISESGFKRKFSTSKNSPFLCKYVRIFNDCSHSVLQCFVRFVLRSSTCLKRARVKTQELVNSSFTKKSHCLFLLGTSLSCLLNNKKHAVVNLKVLV